MYRRPITSRGSHAGGEAPWYTLGLCAAVLAATWLGWAAGRIAALLSVADRYGPGYGQEFLQLLLRGDLPAMFPGVSTTLVAVVFAVLLAAALTLVTVLWLRFQALRPRADDPLPSLAHPHEVATLTGKALEDRARRLRPGLADIKKLASADLGIPIGNLTRPGSRVGPPLYSSWEDLIVAVMGPRTHKTTALAVPAVLAAPGAVVCTSNKADLWAATSAHRERKGAVWLFDPQGITRQPQRFWWNPLAHVRTVEDAFQLADHFMQTTRGDQESSPFWSAAAHGLLTGLILAAACERLTLLNVHDWLAIPSKEPVDVLTRHGHHAVAAALTGRLNGAHETRDGIFEHARTAAACLSSPEITAWVTPPSSAWVKEFDPKQLPNSTDALYLLSKDGGGSAAPLVAALTDQVLQAGVQRAEQLGGRLDPPLVAILDEAANTCPLSSLPNQYSHFGSRGICVITILQSYQQGTRVWGDKGMGTLWSAATVKLIGPGVDDARFAEDLSRLIGEHDVSVTTHSRDGRGFNSWSTQPRRQRIMDAARIRSLPHKSALLLATGAPVAMIRLRPWYEGAQSEEITAAVAAANTLMTSGANRP